MSGNEDESGKRSTALLVKVAKGDDPLEKPIFFVEQNGAVYSYETNSSIRQSEFNFKLCCSGIVLTEATGHLVLCGKPEELNPFQFS